MQEKIKEIADRVRELRELSEIKVTEMAEYLQIPNETYNKYESGIEDFPVGILFKIAHKLHIDMAVLLTGEKPHMNIFTVTRNNKGTSVERRKQYRYKNLAEQFIHKKAEFFIVSVESKPQDMIPETNSHPGQEFNYVLEGTLKVYIHNNEIILKEGDSIYFDSNCEHAMESMGGKPVKFLAIIM
jgi:quercetin dioxygenase-like cupin family protein